MQFCKTMKKRLTTNRKYAIIRTMEKVYTQLHIHNYRKGREE